MILLEIILKYKEFSGRAVFQSNHLLMDSANFSGIMPHEMEHISPKKFAHP